MQRDYGSLTAERVAQLDRASVACGVGVMQLMEIAGWQVARCAWHLLGEQPDGVVVLAGHGNNGGDALVAGRHLASWGCRVVAHVLAQEERLGDVQRSHIASARANGVAVAVSIDTPTSLLSAPVAALVVDGLLGTGLHASPRDPVASTIRVLNSSHRDVLAIDVPSGLDASTGHAYDPCVRATATCTLTAMKVGLWSPSAHEYAGDIWVADIGMPVAAWNAAGIAQPAAVRGGVLVQLPSGTER